MSEFLQAVMEEICGIGHEGFIRDYTELHLASIADDAYAQANIARLGYPEHLFRDGATSEVTTLWRARERSRPRPKPS